MTKEDRTLIKYRMERAYETLDEAEIMFDAGRINAYVNRLYYACFYAVSALLLTKGLTSSKHSYLRSLLHRDFIKTGAIPADLGEHFDLLFNSRQKGDYSDFVTFEAEDVAGWLQSSREFIAHIDRLIKTVK